MGMDTTLTSNALMAEQDKRITETVSRERGRLRNFIRRRVPDPSEAEDILQDVFYRVRRGLSAARTYRTGRRMALSRGAQPHHRPLSQEEGRAACRSVGRGDDEHWLDDVLPSPDAGPEAAYARAVLLEELHAALDELPEEQRDVFIAHELEGRSFKELAAESGVGVNTLLARKRYAVLHLRARLQTIYDEFDL